MCGEGAKQNADLLIALKVLKPKYQKVLMKECDQQKIKHLCESIFTTFDKTQINDNRERKIKFFKLRCFYSTNV